MKRMKNVMFWKEEDIIKMSENSYHNLMNLINDYDIECKRLKTENKKLNKLIDRYDKELKHKTEQYEFLRHNDYLEEKENEINELVLRINKAINFIYENAYSEDRKELIDDLWEEIPFLLRILENNYE